jgi:hypothetical protein
MTTRFLQLTWKTLTKASTCDEVWLLLDVELELKPDGPMGGPSYEE